MISSSRGRGDPPPDRSHDDQNCGRDRCSLKSKGVSLPQRRLKREENSACRNSLLLRAASLFCRDHSLFCRKTFPVTLDREFDHKPLNFRAERSLQIIQRGLDLRISLLISLLSGKWAAETGSMKTVSSASQRGLSRMTT
jgi:hypothetical protein